MPITKYQFAKNVQENIFDLCKIVYNIKRKDEIERVFGLTFAGLEEIIRRIVNALPDELFMQESPHRIKEIEQIFAKEFIFFEIQERTDDPQYQTDLENFILFFARDMQNKLQIWKEEQPK